MGTEFIITVNGGGTKSLLKILKRFTVREFQLTSFQD